MKKLQTGYWGVALTLVVFASPSLQARSKIIRVGAFESSGVGTMPKGWKGRSDASAKYYKVKADDTGNHFVSVQNDGTHEFIGTEANVDLVQYPTLKWRWRAQSLPVDGNESVKSKADSGAAVTVVISGSMLKPKTIKYVWSSTLKVGQETESPYCVWPGQCNIIVIESGPKKMGEWVQESRNVLKDYKRLFDDPDVDELTIDAVLLMSDGDNTKSLVAADYDDLYFQ